MPWIDVDQLDPEWLKMRTAVTTASRYFEITDRLKVNTKNGGKGDYKASRRNYMIELICERLTGRASDHFVTEWMARGKDDEDLARAAYENQCNDGDVTNGGFYLHDTIEYFGASPDARVGDKGILELKNLKPENHYDFIRTSVTPEKYIWQMNAQLACASERDWVDYGSYCKEMPPALRLCIRRHHRDRERVAEVEEEVLKFNAEIAAELLAIAKSRGGK